LLSNNRIFVVETEIRTAVVRVLHEGDIFVLVQIHKAGIALVLVVPDVVYTKFASGSVIVFHKNLDFLKVYFLDDLIIAKSALQFNRLRYIFCKFAKVVDKKAPRDIMEKKGSREENE
jgi:hypothetical protein